MKEFEAKLGDYLGAKYIVAVNSCTAALHLSLAAKNFKPGDAFLVPTHTFVASVEVGEYIGMIPELVDCDSDFNININHIEDRIKNNNNIKCIIPVHLAGKPVNMKDVFLFS